MLRGVHSILQGLGTAGWISRSCGNRGTGNRWRDSGILIQFTNKNDDLAHRRRRWRKIPFSNLILHGILWFRGIKVSRINVSALRISGNRRTGTAGRVFRLFGNRGTSRTVPRLNRGTRILWLPSVPATDSPVIFGALPKFWNLEMFNEL